MNAPCLRRGPWTLNASLAPPTAAVSLLSGLVCRTRNNTRTHSRALASCARGAGLDGNLLRDLPYTTFERQSNLVELFVSGNRLRSLDPAVFFPLARLERLYVRCAPRATPVYCCVRRHGGNASHTRVVSCSWVLAPARRRLADMPDWDPQCKFPTSHLGEYYCASLRGMHPRARELWAQVHSHVVASTILATVCAAGALVLGCGVLGCCLCMCRGAEPAQQATHGSTHAGAGATSNGHGPAVAAAAAGAGVRGLRQRRGRGEDRNHDVDR